MPDSTWSSSFLVAVTVQADHEDMAKATLVLGMGGPQRGVGGERAGPTGTDQRLRREGLLGERLVQLARREVVTGLVGGGEQRFRIRVRTVRGHPLGPAAAAAAAQQHGQRVVPGEGVEAAEPDSLTTGWGRAPPRARADMPHHGGCGGCSVVGRAAGVSPDSVGSSDGCEWVDSTGAGRAAEGSWGSGPEPGRVRSGGGCDGACATPPRWYPAAPGEPCEGVTNGTATLTTLVVRCPKDARISPG